MNSDDWSRLFIQTSLQWKTWLKSYLSKKSPFYPISRIFENEGYHVWVNPVYCPDYGIPQTGEKIGVISIAIGKYRVDQPDA